MSTVEAPVRVALGRQRVARTVAAGLVGTVLAACGADDGSGRSGSVAVTAGTVSGVGKVLVDAQSGRTLYLFLPDAQQASTCSADCLLAWPPLLADAGVPDVGGELRDDLVGVVQDRQGRAQVTYNGWPLYRFVGDLEPGQANGQAVDLDGGLWFAVTPDGMAAGQGTTQ